MKTFVTCATLLYALTLAPCCAAAHSPQFDKAIEASQNWDYVAAVRHMRAAAGQEDARAQEALGFMLIFGDRLYRGAIAQDVGEGLRWLRRAAESGRKPAAYYLAQHARQGARQEASTEVNSSVTTP